MNQAFSKIWIVVILAIFIAGGILAWQYLMAPEEEVVEDETADWKTYSNPKANFTFRYPKNWEIRHDYFYKVAENPTVVVCRQEGPIGVIANCIQINMPQFPCETRTEIEGNWIGICVEDPEISEVYYQVINSFRCFDGEKCVSSEELMTVEVFFSNSELDPEFSCYKVFPVERKMSETLGVARAALEELFKGPTEEEKNQGYFSWFSDIIKDILKSVKIKNNTAYVNLKDIRRIIPNTSTSCGSAIFFAQIGTTLKQFSSVNRIIIAIDSKPSIFYEWIQIGCFEGNDFCDETPFKTSN